jgi:metallo-beta-lactamase family protein
MSGLRLTFLGAANTVTGSRYLVEFPKARVLVDCGLFQGYKQLRLRNWAPPPLDPRKLDAVVLTHAHLDHSGYLPLLVKQGFTGPVHASQATAELCGLLLPDSGHLQEEDAAYANKRGFSRHSPALPLYTEADATRSLERFRPLPFGVDVEIATGVRARLSHAGHLLGAASVRLTAGKTSITFSGDVGRPHDPVMRAPDPLADTDYLVVESTYGDRRHPTADPSAQLADVIRRTAGRGGVVVVPAFAVGRAQTLLHLFAELKARDAIPRSLPAYLNSPMAIDATTIYHRHRSLHRLTVAECGRMVKAATFVSSAEDSRKLNDLRFPMLIIAASGMATGGRVLHHLKGLGPDPRNTILLTGYQAGGTRGAALAAGETSLKIHGQIVPIRAEVATLENLSAHADHDEIIRWLEAAKIAPRRTFVTHGEPEAADAMRRHLRDRLGWDAVVPEHLERVDLAG